MLRSAVIETDVECNRAAFFHISRINVIKRNVRLKRSLAARGLDAVRIPTNLNLSSPALCRQGTIQQVDSVEIRAVGDTVDFVFQGSNFLLKVLTVYFVSVCSVRGLVSQFYHTVQHGVNFRHGTLGRLHQRNTIVGILLGGLQTGNLGTHFFGNRQAGSVVARAIDSVTRGKFLQVLGNGTVVYSQVTIRV